MSRSTKLFLLLLPFLIMIITNEVMRSSIQSQHYGGYGVTFINGEVWTKDHCSWACHNSTAYCMKHHIAYVRPIKQYIDPIYFGIIRFLKSFQVNGFSGYAAANLVFLVIGWPLLMWYLLVRCIEMRRQLKDDKLW